MLRALLIGIVLSFLAFAGFSASYPFNPVLDNTDRFERHYRVTTAFPFLTSYLLLTPPDYDRRKRYPLVLALHGGYKRSLGAYVAAQTEFQKRHETFVLMPMALFGQHWVKIDANGAVVGPSASLREAVDILADVAKDFPVDRSRVYVTGSSNGAIGTFAAMKHFPEVFAAGVAVNGGWPVDDAGAFRSAKLAIYHGTEDRLNPVGGMRALVHAIRASGEAPEYVEMAGTGHDSRPAYRNTRLWDWLFARRL
ncbi:MAG: prolyl oligopeptidase family serine peptidase [Alphaproteobacteria bacterium]